MDKRKITLGELETFLFEAADILWGKWTHRVQRIHFRHAVLEWLSDEFDAKRERLTRQSSGAEGFISVTVLGQNSFLDITQIS